MFSFLAAAALLAVSGETTAKLWTSLSQGDDAEVVASKLRVLPEIKAVKVKQPKKAVKEPELSIDYKGDGFDILGSTYDLNPTFEVGGLSRVELAAKDTCRNTSFDRYSRIVEVLKEKYPQVAAPEFAVKDKVAFLKAEMATNTATNGVVETAFTDGETVVYVWVAMYGIQRPSVSYGGNATMRALSNLQWSIYQTQASACGGEGSQRAQIRIIYLSHERFLAKHEKAASQSADDREVAKTRL